MKYIEALCILVALGPVLARPQSEGRASRLEDDWRPMSNYRYVRPVYRPDPPLSRESKNQNIQNDTQSSNSPLTTSSAESARRVPTTATPIGESLKMVTKQLLQSPTATDMVVADIRTPPKIKNQLKLEEFVSVGKGEAVPVPLDEIHAYEIISSTHKSIDPSKGPSTTEPTTLAGISTWVLLSGSDGTTPTSIKKVPKPTASIQAVSNPLGKKKTKPTTESSSSLNVSETSKSSIENKLEKKPSTNDHLKQITNSTKKFQSNSSKEETVKTPITINLQDSRFKNRTPVTMGRVPTTSITKNKTEYVSTSSKKKTNTTTPTPSASSELKNESSNANSTSQNRRKPVASLPASIDGPTTITIIPTAVSSNKRVPVYHHDIPVVPTTSVIIETESADYDPDEITTEDLITTTKRPRRPANKKKKKPINKNRRRPPATQNAESETLKEDVLESKVTNDGNSTKTAVATKISPTSSRPLSTRIYNYLAREVMPSVGVGIVGLVLTAGLAGLFLYPFGGGVVARRNAYDPAKNSLTSPDSHMYYYNEYSPKTEPDNGQAEETVFGQVLSGMSQAESQYSDSISKNSASTYNHNTNVNSNNGNKYRYDPSPSAAGAAAAVVYPTKDAKYSQTSDHASIDRDRDSSAYSTLTDIDSAHNDRNYPSLTTENPDLSQFPGSQYSNMVGGSSASQFSSSGSSGNTGMYVGSIINPDTNFTYSSLVGSSSMKTSDSKQHYSNIVSSPTVLTASDNSNSIPQYSSLIASPSTASNSEAEGTSSAQYLNRFASSSSGSQSSNSRPHYSSLIGSSASPQYSSIVDSASSSHYSPSMKESSNTHFSPHISDSSNSKYSQLTGISIESSNGKYSSMTPTHSSKYQANEYTAYSNPSDIGTQGGMYSVSSSSANSERENHRPAPQSTRYSEVDYSSEHKDSIPREEDKSDKSQPQFTALHSSQFSAPSRTETAFPSGIDMISITGPNYSIGTSSESRRSSISSIGIEHGPRNLKVRRRRQISSHNEIDGDLPKDEPDSSTTAKYSETNQDSTTQTEAITNSPTSTVESETTTFSSDKNETANESVVNSVKIVENLDDTDELTTSKPQEDATFLGVIRRIAQFKFKLGLNLLRSTSMAVSRYFQSVQRRMEKVIRRIEKRAKEAEQQRKSINEKTVERRTKREAKKGSHQKLKKAHKKKRVSI